MIAKILLLSGIFYCFSWWLYAQKDYRQFFKNIEEDHIRQPWVVPFAFFLHVLTPLPGLGICLFFILLLLFFFILVALLLVFFGLYMVLIVILMFVGTVVGLFEGRPIMGFSKGLDKAHGSVRDYLERKSEEKNEEKS